MKSNRSMVPVVKFSPLWDVKCRPTLLKLWLCIRSQNSCGLLRIYFYFICPSYRVSKLLFTKLLQEQKSVNMRNGHANCIVSKYTIKPSESLNILNTISLDISLPDCTLILIVYQETMEKSCYRVAARRH